MDQEGTTHDGAEGMEQEGTDQHSGEGVSTNHCVEKLWSKKVLSTWWRRYGARVALALVAAL